MRAPSPRWLLLGLTAGLACAKAGGKDATESKPLTKRERCEAIARNTTQTAGLAVGMMAGSLSDRPLTEQDHKELRIEMQRVEAEFIDQCVDWDDEVLECFRLFKAGSDRCQEVLEVAMGGTLPPKDVPEGPKALWSYELPGEAEHMGLVDGMVVAAVNETIVAVSGGKHRWSLHGLAARKLAVPPDGTGEPIIALTWDEVVGIAPDGTIAFRTELPVIPDPDAEELGEEWVDKQHPETIARVGDGWLIGDDGARLLTLSPKGELAVRWQLSGEYFDSDARLYPLADGTLLLQESVNLRRIDAEGNVQMDVRALDDLAAVHVGPGDAITLRIDGDLVRLDLEACASNEPFAPSGFPQAGRFVYVDEDLACRECTKPPRGCVQERTYVESFGSDLLGVRQGAPTVVESEDGILGMRGNTRQWGHALSAESAGTVVDNRFVFVGRTWSETPAPLKLWSLGFDGTVHWAATIPGPADDENLYWSDAGNIVVRGTHAAIALRRTLSVIPLGPS